MPDNENLDAKCDLRRALLAELDERGADKISVLDCCAGQGVIWKRLRKERKLAGYLGMDSKKIENTLRMNSVRFLIQPGWKFNFVDIDTYGSPWKHWEAMLQAIPENEWLAVALCVGVIKSGSQPLNKSTARALGLTEISPLIPQIISNEIEDRYGTQANLASAVDFGARIDLAIEALNPGSGGRWGGNVRHIGVILRKETVDVAQRT